MYRTLTSRDSCKILVLVPISVCQVRLTLWFCLYYFEVVKLRVRGTHFRKSAALRASRPSSLPTSSPGKAGAEEIAFRVASAAATPVKGIPAALSGEDEYDLPPRALSG